MDEEFQRASYYDGYSRPRYRYRSSPDNPYGQNSSYSYLTGPGLGILVAVLVIYLFQRKDGFGRLLAAKRERGLVSTLLDCCFELRAYAIAYFQVALDVFRTLSLVSLEDWYPYDFNATTTPNSPSIPKRRRNMAAHANRLTTSQMPELEETDVNKLAVDETPPTRNIHIGALEPAFLRDDDYPPGWLVFDPVLGVVSKAEADKRIEQQSKAVDEIPPTPQLPPPLESSQSPMKQAPKEMHQTPPQPTQFKANQNKNNNKKSAAAARNLHNGYRNPSPMHTPHPIVANG